MQDAEPWRTLATALGKQIRRLRQGKRWTQEKLARQAALDVKYLGSCERGERNVSLGTVLKLLNAFGVEPYELFAFGLWRDLPTDRADETVFRNLLKLTDKETRARAIDLVKHLIRASNSKNR